MSFYVFWYIFSDTEAKFWAVSLPGQRDVVLNFRRYYQIVFHRVCTSVCVFLFSLSSTENNITFACLPLWFVNIFVLFRFIFINEVKGFFFHILGIYLYFSITNFISFILFYLIIDFNKVLVILRKLAFITSSKYFFLICSYFDLVGHFCHIEILHVYVVGFFHLFLSGFCVGTKFTFVTTANCCLSRNEALLAWRSGRDLFYCREEEKQDQPHNRFVLCCWGLAAV